MDNCIFCKIVNKEIPSNVIYEDDKVIAILDLHPACDGHTLIIPKKHVEDMMNIDDETILCINNIAKKLTPVLMDKMNAKGFATRVNYGDAQEIKHYHMHLLPDYLFKKPSKDIKEVYEILKDSIK